MSWSPSKRRSLGALIAAWSLVSTRLGLAQTTPGYPEKVVQWTVQAGESCADVAKAMYGSAKRVDLVLRYNRVSCTPGAPLATDLTLVLPAEVTVVPTARITSVNPETRARPAGGGWSPAVSGQPLSSSSAVNTLEEGRAGIRFIDRSRVYLASNTLVVIYGTASQSHVSKTRPARVQLDRGELQAGLAALRGGSSESDAVEVDVAGGGRVSASSRDTVLRRKGTRTNVSVFDGKAEVESAGKRVAVPRNFGTRFVDQKPPEPPRPLPPAPAWAGPERVVVFTGAGGGTIKTSWAPIPKAQTYRIELSRDAAFEDLIAREHVQADVRAFRAEQLPPGRYHVRIRGIDTDDFLGIAAPPRTVEVVEAQWSRGTGQLDDDGIMPGRYAILSMKAPPHIQMAQGDGAFGPVPSRLDFSRLDVDTLRFRRRNGQAEQEIPVRYAEAKATIELDESPQGLTLKVRFGGLDRLDVSRDVGPRLLIRHGDESITIALEARPDGSFVGFAPNGAEVSRIDAVDQRGRVLGTLVPRPKSTPPPFVVAPEPFVYPTIGSTTPYVPMSPRIAVGMLAPTSPRAAEVGALFESDGDPAAIAGFARGSGQIGPVGVDGTIRTRQGLSDRPADTGGWVGLRYRAWRMVLSEVDGTTLELAPRLAVTFPLDDESPSPQLETSVLFGGAVGDASWVLNLGGRARLGRRGQQQAFVDEGQIYLLGGGAYLPLPWLRVVSALDLHLLVPGGGLSPLFRGGLTGGIELGQTFFVSLQGRISPWNDVGGYGGGQLALGLRSWP